MVRSIAYADQFVTFLSQLHEASCIDMPRRQQISLPLKAGVNLLLWHHDYVTRVPHVYTSRFIIFFRRFFGVASVIAGGGFLFGYRFFLPFGDAQKNDATVLRPRRTAKRDRAHLGGKF